MTHNFKRLKLHIRLIWDQAFDNLDVQTLSNNSGLIC